MGSDVPLKFLVAQPQDADVLADLWFKAYKQTHFDILPPDLLNYRGRNSFLLRMFTKIQDLKTIVALEASVAIIEPPRKTELCSTAQEDDHAENIKNHAHNSESARFHRDKKSSTGEIEQFFLALAAQNRCIGQALQKTEKELTEEAQVLIKTLKESIAEGKTLYNLVEHN